MYDTAKKIRALLLAWELFVYGIVTTLFQYLKKKNDFELRSHNAMHDWKHPIFFDKIPFQNMSFREIPSFKFTPSDRPVNFRCLRANTMV